MRPSVSTRISGTCVDHCRTLLNTTSASPFGNGDRIDPWFNDANRPAVSPFNAGTFGATALNSTLDGTELEARLAGAAAGRYSLVYAAPERLRQRPFLHALKRAGVSLLVVDEVHW